MSVKLTITDHIHNALVRQFNERVKTFNLKGKKLLDEQAQFFAGACTAIDAVNTEMGMTEPLKETCITPDIYFSILRGDRITERKSEEAGK